MLCIIHNSHFLRVLAVCGLKLQWMQALSLLKFMPVPFLIMGTWTPCAQFATCKNTVCLDFLLCGNHIMPLTWNALSEVGRRKYLSLRLHPSCWTNACSLFVMGMHAEKPQLGPACLSFITLSCSCEVFLTCLKWQFQV